MNACLKQWITRMACSFSVEGIWSMKKENQAPGMGSGQQQALRLGRCFPSLPGKNRMNGVVRNQPFCRMAFSSCFLPFFRVFFLYSEIVTPHRVSRIPVREIQVRRSPRMMEEATTATTGTM